MLIYVSFRQARAQNGASLGIHIYQLQGTFFIALQLKSGQSCGPSWTFKWVWRIGTFKWTFFGKGLWLPGRSGKVRSVNIDWISRPRGDRNGLVIPFKHPLVNVYKKLWKMDHRNSGFSHWKMVDFLLTFTKPANLLVVQWRFQPFFRRAENCWNDDDFTKMLLLPAANQMSRGCQQLSVVWFAGKNAEASCRRRQAMCC
jgi:hypothetical protein